MATQVSQYQKGKTSLDFTKARNSEFSNDIIKIKLASVSLVLKATT